MLAKGTRILILRLVRGQFYERNYGPDVDPEDGVIGGWCQFRGDDWRSIAVAIVLVHDGREWSPLGVACGCCLA